MIARIELPWPPAILSPNARPAHWGSRYRAAGRARRGAHAATLAAKPGAVPAEGHLALRMVAYPPSRRVRDRDNLLGALKSSLDGIADALRVGDHRFVPFPIEIAEPRRPAVVIVTVEALP